jgi:hypothetical protein
MVAILLISSSLISDESGKHNTRLAISSELGQESA